jgi:hypothetical protein
MHHDYLHTNGRATLTVVRQIFAVHVDLRNEQADRGASSPPRQIGCFL